jgi:putative intracellular protease/amidase
LEHWIDPKQTGFRHKELDMKVLIVLTSHDRLGDTGNKTGFWLEELAAPYYALKDAGVKVTLASLNGGQPPLGPKSDLPENETHTTKRFPADKVAQAQLANTKGLADVSADDFDAVFYPDGHGPMWDMPDNATFIVLIEAFVKADKPVGAVCHAPTAFTNVHGKDGEYLVRGRKVTDLPIPRRKRLVWKSSPPSCLKIA